MFQVYNKGMQIAEHIVQGFLAGETTAFHELYLKTRQALYSLIAGLTADPAEAEDLLHDVYVRMYEKRSSFDGCRAALYTWMYRIAVNQTLNRIRQKKRWNNEVFVEDLVMGPEPDKDWEVQEILQKINPDFRACLVLHELEGLAYAEIAQVLSVSIGTVRSRISRAKAQLKKVLKSQGGEL